MLLRLLFALFCFALPFLVYLSYRYLKYGEGFKQNVPEDIARKLYLSGFGLVAILVIIIFILTDLEDEKSTGEFVPAYVKDGKVVPSHFK
ncbi:MAG: hypothetical protein AAF621_08245 [Pseudomonadota bacterium]